MKRPAEEIEVDGPSLTPGKAASLPRSGAEVWLVFGGARGARLTARRLAALPPGLQRRFCVAGEFGPADAGAILSSSRLFRGLDIKELVLELAPRADWSGRALARLRAELGRIARDYARELDSGSFPWPQPSRLYGIDLAGGSFAPPGAAARAVRAELGHFSAIERKLRRMAAGDSAGALEFLQPLGPRPPRGVAGGKAASLLRLSAEGLPVPPTYALAAGTARSLFPPGRSGKGAGCLRSSRGLRFFAELRGLFPPGRPFIVRSSAGEEDGPAASFAGIYRSEAVKAPGEAAGAIRRCLYSGRDAGAAAYRRLSGRRRAVRGMALLFQPFVEAGLGGVVVFDGRGRIVLELSRGGNAGITGGRSADWRFTLDARSRRLDCPPGAPLGRAAAARLLSTLASAKSRLFPSGGAVFEFLLGDGGPLFLQARPLPAAAEPPRADMKRMFIRIAGAMRALGLAPGDWSLSETADAAAFNFLGLARPAGERLEHFRVRLSRAARDKIARRGWISVKYDGDDDILFPSDLPPRRRAALERLAREGIFVIFALPRKGERPLSRVLPFRDGGRRVGIRFSYLPEGLEKEEERDLLRRDPGDAASWLRRLARERGIWLAVRRRLRAGKAGRYGRALLSAIPAELALIARKERLARRAAARAPGAAAAVKGTPFRPMDAVLSGTAVTAAKAAAWKGGPFFYFGHDLEPCFLPLMDRIKAVVVSRGAFGSHAAQICSELGVPLILETSNLGRIGDGDSVELDLRTGEVRRKPE